MFFNDFQLFQCFFQYHQKKGDDLHIEIWHSSLQRYRSLYCCVLCCPSILSCWCTAGLQNSSLPQDSTGSSCWSTTLQPLISFRVCYYREYRLRLHELAVFTLSKMTLQIVFIKVRLFYKHSYLIYSIYKYSLFISSLAFLYALSFICNFIL